MVQAIVKTVYQVPLIYFLWEVRLVLLVCSGTVSGAACKLQRLLECSVVTVFSWGNTRNVLIS